MSAPKNPAAGRWLRRGMLIILTVCAGVMLWSQQKWEAETPPALSPSPAPEALREERNIREAAYDKDIAALEKLLESGAADEQTQAQAAQRLERMTQEHQSEIAIEEALIHAGYRPVLVLYQNGALTVMVEEALNAEASAAVLSLCAIHADVPAENVRIMTASP